MFIILKTVLDNASGAVLPPFIRISELKLAHIKRKRDKKASPDTRESAFKS
jgi:hypothetical protein